MISRNTFGAGIADDKGKILANARDVFIPPKGKGIIPRDAAQNHSEAAVVVVKEALKQAKLSLQDIDLIAFSAGPGLPPCLRVGAAVARALALKLKKPLIGVNHAVAHIEIGKLTTGAKDPVAVYVSGGNTQILALVEKRYRVFGETLDIPIGNALDLVAREIGLGNPGGPLVENSAAGGKYLRLPYVVKGMDLSFAGIATEAVRRFRTGASAQDVCFSLQETCFAMLVEVTERALAHTGKNEVLVVGGVAANKRFAEMLDIMCRERSADVGTNANSKGLSTDVLSSGAHAFAVPMEYAGDGGAMIAWAGLLAHRANKKGISIEQSKVNSRWRVDEVDITW